MEKACGSRMLGRPFFYTKSPDWPASTLQFLYLLLVQETLRTTLHGVFSTVKLSLHLQEAPGYAQGYLLPPGQARLLGKGAPGDRSGMLLLLSGGRWFIEKLDMRLGEGRAQDLAQKGSMHWEEEGRPAGGRPPGPLTWAEFIT